MTSGNQKEEPVEIKVPQLTPVQEEIGQVSAEAQSKALELMRAAISLADYMKWRIAASMFFTYEAIKWYWDYEGTTAEQLIEGQLSDGASAMYEKEAKIAMELRSAIEAVTPPQEGMIRFAIRRVSEKHELGGRKQTVYHPRVLAVFPERIPVGDFLDTIQNNYPDGSGKDSIYLKPENACTEHAFDDLFKVNNESHVEIGGHKIVVFDIPIDRLTEMSTLTVDEHGVARYLLKKTEDATYSIKQDPSVYALNAVMGGFGNENFRIRISAFGQ